MLTYKIKAANANSNAKEGVEMGMCADWSGWAVGAEVSTPQ